MKNEYCSLKSHSIALRHFLDFTHYTVCDIEETWKQNNNGMHKKTQTLISIVDLETNF